MQAQHLLVGVVDYCRRHACAVVLAGLALAVFAGFYASSHLGLSSETDLLFSADLPWRKRAAAIKADFPQHQDLLVAVIDARQPEEAEAAASALAAILSGDRAHFQLVRRPDGSPFFAGAGFLFLDIGKLEAILDRIIDAQPFLGELARASLS